MNKVLYLHGMFGQNSYKSYLIRSLGFEVFAPILSDWSFSKSIEIAKNAFSEFDPDIVVGSSRGAAVAMNIETGKSKLILLSPPWFIFGKETKCKSDSIIIHSPNDSLIPFSKSEELSEKSNCVLLAAGTTHNLNCYEGKKAIVDLLNSMKDQ